MTKTRDLADLGGGFIQAGTGAVQRTVESKLQDVVSVKDFGAVGDGVADDTAAIQAAVNYCDVNTTSLLWPEGDYLTTSSISRFHFVKHKGKGRILRGSDIFAIEPTDSDVNIIYVSASATDNNDGLSASQPIRTLSRVKTVLTNTTADQRNGTWRFKFAAGTYSDSTNFPNLPFFAKPLEFIGTGTSRTPQTIFDGTAAAYQTAGMYFSNRTNVYLQYIQFQNFASGYGVVAEYNCQIELEDCNSISCSTGFAAALSSYIQTTRCRAQGCSIGFSVAKNSQASFTPKTNNIADSNRMIACGIGVTVTRNSYAHVDYNEFEDCTGTALQIEINSRATALANNFKRNVIAVRCWTSGYVSLNEPSQANTYNQGTADANTEVYEFRGGSGIVNLHGQAGTTDNSVYKFITPTTVTGTAAETQIAGTLFTAWAGWLIEPTKRIKVKAWGTVTTPADGTLNLKTKLQTTSLTAIDIPSNLTAAPFMLEAETIAINDTTQKTFSRVVFGTNGSVTQIRNTTLDNLSGNRVLTFYTDANGVGAVNVSVTIESIEVEICG